MMLHRLSVLQAGTLEFLSCTTETREAFSVLPRLSPQHGWLIAHACGTITVDTFLSDA
jgi:hypothetical protein